MSSFFHFLILKERLTPTRVSLKDIFSIVNIKIIEVPRELVFIDFEFCFWILSLTLEEGEPAVITSSSIMYIYVYVYWRCQGDTQNITEFPQASDKDRVMPVFSSLSFHQEMKYS